MIGRVVVINDFSIARGGATGLALLSAKLLHESGLPVTYIAGDKSMPDNGIESVSLSGEEITEKNRAAGMITGLYNQPAATKLAAWIAQNDRPDTIYHLHGWSKILSPHIVSALRLVAPRIVLHAHDFFLVCPNGAQFHYGHAETCHLKPLSAACLTSACDKRSYADKLWRSLRQAILNQEMKSGHIVPGFGKIILIHEKMRPFFLNAGIAEHQLETIRNPVIPFSETRVPVENNRHAYFIGRLMPEKGVIDAIRATRLAQVPLRVIGDGPLRQELSAQYPDIEFLGWRSAADIRGLIKEARMALMPSHYPEPFGLAALEAAQSGIPVILSDRAFLAEEFLAQDIGLACDTADHTAFAAQLRHLRDMPPGEIQAMSERALARAPTLSTTQQGWRDALIACYSRQLGGGS